MFDGFFGHDLFGRFEAPASDQQRRCQPRPYHCDHEGHEKAPPETGEPAQMHGGDKEGEPCNGEQKSNYFKCVHDNYPEKRAHSISTSFEEEHFANISSGLRTLNLYDAGLTAFQSDKDGCIIAGYNLFLEETGNLDLNPNNAST